MASAQGSSYDGVGVGVVIAHYGDPRHAAALAADLLSRPGRLPLQVVVADDCSPTPFGEQPGVEVVRRSTNGGFGSAVNAGAALVRHDLMLILNSDLSVPAGFVDELVERGSAYLPGVVAPTVVTGGRVTGGQRFPRPRYQLVEWVSVLGRWRDRPWFAHAIGKVAPAPRGGARRVDWVAGEAMLLRTADFRRVGGFDESFFMYAEEVDLQRRLRDVGVPAVLVDTTPVLHAGAASTDPERARLWLTESRLRYAAKWAGSPGGGPSRLVAALRIATALNLAVAVVRRAAGRDVHPWRSARAEWGLIRQARVAAAQVRAR